MRTTKFIAPRKGRNIRSKTMAKAKTTDFTAYVNEAMANFPVDMTAYNDAFKTSAAMGEK